MVSVWPAKTCDLGSLPPQGLPSTHPQEELLPLDTTTTSPHNTLRIIDLYRAHRRTRVSVSINRVHPQTRHYKLVLTISEPVYIQLYVCMYSKWPHTQLVHSRWKHTRVKYPVKKLYWFWYIQYVRVCSINFTVTVSLARAFMARSHWAKPLQLAILVQLSAAVPLMCRRW